MANWRNRASSISLSLPLPSSASVDTKTKVVLSPMTELAVNLEHNSISLGRTPKRRLSMSSIGTPSPCPTRSPLFQRTMSNESGFGSGPSSPVGHGMDSPTVEYLMANSRRRKGNPLLRKPVFRRWNSSPDGTKEDTLSDDKENLHHLNGFGTTETPSKLDEIQNEQQHQVRTKADNSFEFVKPKLPERLQSGSFERKLRDAATRSLSDPTPQATDGDLEEIVSPSKSESDSQDSGAYEFDFDDINDDDDDDDGFMSIVQEEQEEAGNTTVPQGMESLVSAPIVATSVTPPSADGKCSTGETPKQGGSYGEVQPRHLFNTTSSSHRTVDLLRERSKSIAVANPSNCGVRERSKSFALKRPNPPRDSSPMERKRLRHRCMSVIEGPSWPSRVLDRPSPLHQPSPFRRSLSLAEPKHDFNIHELLGTDQQNDFIGDFSKSYVLPVLEGQDAKHKDLKSIAPETVAKLLDNKYSSDIDEHYIIDCRYPYEYEGGHVRGAINIYNKEDMMHEFLEKPKCRTGKRLVIIFHCEFSSKRAPDMSRFLRNRDREIHSQCYPKLFYPELYLIEGGYKAFYTKCQEYCEPQSYRLMADENFVQEFRRFSKRSKSWTEGSFKKSCRPGLNY